MASCFISLLHYFYHDTYFPTHQQHLRTLQIQESFIILISHHSNRPWILCDKLKKLEISAFVEFQMTPCHPFARVHQACKAQLKKTADKVTFAGGVLGHLVETGRHTQNKNLVKVGQVGIENRSWFDNNSQSLSHFRVLRMGRAESKILVTHSHLTNLGWSGELHYNLHLVTLPIVINKLVNWLTNFTKLVAWAVMTNVSYWCTVTSCDQPF